MCPRCTQRFSRVASPTRTPGAVRAGWGDRERTGVAEPQHRVGDNPLLSLMRARYQPATAPSLRPLVASKACRRIAPDQTR
jgi:hypothetical protein